MIFELKQSGASESAIAEALKVPEEVVLLNLTRPPTVALGKQNNGRDPRVLAAKDKVANSLDRALDVIADTMEFADDQSVRFKAAQWIAEAGMGYKDAAQRDDEGTLSALNEVLKSAREVYDAQKSLVTCVNDNETINV